ncbi:hypothetical protein L1987_49463 [Smallanthus sonchifolius]|uniref:Uncharacterized protein n=1 Tax=Smallanthus sonchifolius TaxID=185202 RepID=A0ACB9FUU1_9ASTR|nr:hypothetical protein L1987_49463 [Smallanthus sonchifolius]
MMWIGIYVAIASLFCDLAMAVDLMHDYDDQDKYNEPMVWIGFYVAIASLLCLLAMVADLLHVTMKLPVDLSGDMPNQIDQAAKLESLAFMCTMMANLMPSLAAMDNKTLLIYYSDNSRHETA